MLKMGFDFLKGSSLNNQERLLECQLSLTEPTIPLILHIRGNREDKSGEWAYSHCLWFLKDKIKRDQIIQLHSFSGTTRQIQEWLEAFPNTYFSLSGLIRFFNTEKTEALKAIPIERLLLETDAPYLPIRKNIHHNSPVYLGELMERVAALRGLSLIEVSKWNEDNFQTVFKL